MRRSGTRASRVELLLLVSLVAWGVFPLVALIAHAIRAHATLTGADGLIGADGVLGADQLQYLAWARDAGTHGLASDLFSLAPSSHVYLEPLFTITGVLWRLGLSLQLAYLLWKPVAAAALFLTTLALARRVFGDDLRARAAAVALSLFLYTPVTALVSWAKLGAGPFRFQMYLLGYELLPANKLWGYVPSALGLAMMPVVLLGTERALIAARPTTGAPGRPEPAGAGRPLALATLAAVLAALLHPWQGVTLLVILAGLAVWQRLRGWRVLLAPAVGAGLPLLYYLVLSRNDPAWQLAAHNEVIARLPALVLLAGLGPLALIAVFGVRRPGVVVIERALLLWIAGCFVTYFTVNSFAPHALQGLSLPFAVLAVRGWRRLRLPAVLGALAIALVTLPGLAYDARKFIDVSRGRAVQYYLTSSDTRALAWVSDRAPGGGVLAPTPFAAVVPSQTGRSVWVGHGYWSRDYAARARMVDSLFGARLRGASARSFVLGTGATILISDCAHRANLTERLGAVLASVHPFGCARVYVLRRAAAGRSPRR
jgi:hypothetical protein